MKELATLVIMMGLLVWADPGLQDESPKSSIKEPTYNDDGDRIGANGKLVTQIKKIRMAFMFPHNSKLKHLIGHTMEYAASGEQDIITRYSHINALNSAGALMIAVDRIEEEGLLPGVNLTVDWRYDQCDESVAAGLAIQLLRDQCDVVFGPPCSVPAQIVAVMANYYNIPQFSWAATSIDLADTTRYPTLVRIIGEAYRLGRAMTEVLLYFGWSRVAMFYTDDKGTQKCLSVAQGAFKFFPLNNIHIVLYQEIDREVPTDAEIEKFLNHFPQLTRICILCIDMDTDIRRFMLRAQEKGATGEEYVYLVPDYVRSENRTDIWVDRTDNADGSARTDFEMTSGRNQESRESMQNLMFLEMLLTDPDKLFAFKKEVIQRIKQWPFFYNDADLTQQYGSLYSPFLHDAVYAYALALNRTLESGDALRDGRVIMKNTKNTHFQGMSGHVIIDDVAGREPTFVLKGFSKSGNLTELLKAEMYKKEGNRVTQLVPEQVMWETRNGFAPKWYPRCGWLGELCESEAVLSTGAIIGISVGSAVLLVVAVVGFFFYYRNKMVQDEMAQMLWKIDQRQLLKLVEMQNSGSLATVSTDVSDDIAEIVLRGDDRVAYFRNTLVWLKAHGGSMVMSSKKDHYEIKLLRDITHDNLNMFIGLCFDGHMPLSVWRYASKGSLQDVLLNPQVKLDFYFKYSLIRDLISGMEHLHKSEIGTHGHLTSSNCLVNSRWVLCITDFGLPLLRQKVREDKQLLWTSPELLRMSNPPVMGTKEGDVYAFAIVVSEILSRDIAFGSHNKAPEDILNLVRAGLDPGFRPDLAAAKKDPDMDPQMITLMRDCWIEDPNLRPDFKHIKNAVKQMSRGREGTLLDHVMKMMERYAANMENTIAERTRDLADETKKTDLLLYKFLPKQIADKLKSGQSVEPEALDNVSVVFSSIAQFQTILEKSTPLQVVLMLNDIYYQLDEIIDDYECFKVQSVNDVYMLACGLDATNQESVDIAKSKRNDNAQGTEGRHHCVVAADMALHFQLRMATYFMPHLPNEKCQLCIGINTGPAVAGVIGQATPRYLLFGKTIDIAKTLVESAKAATIHIAEETNEYLTTKIGGYITKPRGEMNLKHGTIYTYWLLGKKVKGIEDKTSSISQSSGNEAEKKKK